MRKLNINVKQSQRDGTKVFVNLDNRTFLELDWRCADELARSLTAIARKCEELERAPAIARDHAILLRAGVPIGLTDNPKIKELAVSIAAHDRDLRRYMPNGIKSEENFGVPTIKRGVPAATKQ